MNSKGRLTNGLIIGFLALLIGGIGFAIGNSKIGEYNPQWTSYSIKGAPKNIVKIVHVEIKSTLPDSTGDIVYVSDKDGVIYSNTTFQSEWSILEPVPTWNNDRLSKCTNEKLGTTDSHMWDAPPINKQAIDSLGLAIERPVSTIVRCYVLLDDGKLEVWTHSGNGMDLTAGEFTKIMFGVFGAIIGVIIGIGIIRFRKRESNTSN